MIAGGDIRCTPTPVAASANSSSSRLVEIDRGRRGAGGEEQAHAADQDEGDAGRIEARMGLEAEHVAPEGQRFVEIVAAGERDLAERRRAGREPAHRLRRRSWCRSRRRRQRWDS